MLLLLLLLLRLLLWISEGRMKENGPDVLFYLLLICARWLRWRCLIVVGRWGNFRNRHGQRCWWIRMIIVWVQSRLLLLLRWCWSSSLLRWWGRAVGILVWSIFTGHQRRDGSLSLLLLLLVVCWRTIDFLIRWMLTFVDWTCIMLCFLNIRMSFALLQRLIIHWIGFIRLHRCRLEHQRYFLSPIHSFLLTVAFGYLPKFDGSWVCSWEVLVSADDCDWIWWLFVLFAYKLRKENRRHNPLRRRRRRQVLTHYQWQDAESVRCFQSWMNQVQPMDRLEHAVRMDWTRPLLLNHEDGSWSLRCVTRVNYFLRNCNERGKDTESSFKRDPSKNANTYCGVLCWW